MSRGKKIGMILMAAASLYMTACGSSIPQMTEEQNNQVVEYAAGLLLRHDKNNPNKLVEIPEETVAEETKTPEKPTPAEETEKQPEQTAQEEAVVDRSAGVVENQYNSMEEFYGIEGINVTYTGYELKDAYPETGEEELFFAMQASTGSKLLVLKFQVSNTGTNDQSLNMMSLGTKFKVSVDGKTPRYALTTMLSDDLASYTGTIPAGASENLVLVSEIAEEETGSIQNLSLIMKKGSEDGTLVLAE